MVKKILNKRRRLNISENHNLKDFINEIQVF
jgi:hypothetical protein